jgi:hypothetical protein
MAQVKSQVKVKVKVKSQVKVKSREDPERMVAALAA